MAHPVEDGKFRAVIRFPHLKGNRAKEMRAELVAVNGANAAAYDAVVGGADASDVGKRVRNTNRVERGLQQKRCRFAKPTLTPFLIA